MRAYYSESRPFGIIKEDSILQIVTDLPAQTEELGRYIVQRPRGGEMLVLFGGMGMGETVFTWGLAAGLGISSGISNPTFSIVNEYHGRLTVYHFSMFQVESWEDLESMGFFDYLDTDAVLVIEWNKNIIGTLPPDAVIIELSAGKTGQKRIFRIEGLEL